MVKVSVISPIYNGEKYLYNFLKSVCNQTLTDIEIILVDDGSNDNSREICYEFAKMDKRIKIYTQKNKGPGIARNLGLKEATGKYIYFCDPDDYLDQNLLKDNYLLAEKNKANLVVFGIYNENNDGILINKVIPSKGFYYFNIDFRKIFIHLYYNNLLYVVWNKLYLRSSLRNHRFSSIKYGEDTRFNLDHYSNVSRVLYNDNCYYHYIKGGGLNQLLLLEMLILPYLGWAKLQS